MEPPSHPGKREGEAATTPNGERKVESFKSPHKCTSKQHPPFGRTGLVMAYGGRRRVGYRRVHQASMITSWAMPVSMV